MDNEAETIIATADYFLLLQKLKMTKMINFIGMLELLELKLLEE